MDEYFIVCVKNNNLNTIKQLIENKSNDITFDDNKALLLSCAYGYTDILLLLIKNNVNINIHDGHLLNIALSGNNKDIVEILLSNNIIIKRKNLILALAINKLHFFRILIKYIVIDDYIQSILDISFERNNNRIIVELIKRGYNYNTYKNNYSIIRANKYIENLNNIYKKLLNRINKKLYNEINHIIISYLL